MSMRTQISGLLQTKPRRFTAIVLVAVEAGATLPAVSQAASQPYSPERVCGAGYTQIDRVSLGLTGTTYLLYNADNGFNCVVTLKATSPQTRTKVGAYLLVAGQTKATIDSGQFQYYAGPVRALAAGKCVKWGGWHGDARRDMPSGTAAPRRRRASRQRHVAVAQSVARSVAAFRHVAQRLPVCRPVARRRRSVAVLLSRVHELRRVSPEQRHAV
jgi:hypothetical protein